jgi:hypothetical protein
MNYNYPYYPAAYNYAPAQNYQQQNNQNGFIGVQNENEARTYPVQLGTSMTFRDESQPNTFYTKTMGNSPLDRPIFERYRLVKEDVAENAPRATESPEKTKDIDLSVYALKDEIRPLEARISVLQKEVDSLRDKPRRRILKEMEVDDDE